MPGPPPTALSPERPGNEQNRDPRSNAPATSNSTVQATRSTTFAAGQGRDWGPARNPAFIQHYVRSVWGTRLWRGRITQLQAYQGAPHRYTLNFLYNPGAITSVFGFDESRAIYTDPQNAQVPDLMTGMNVSFQLLFVRQYEILVDPSHEGVLVDTGHLERMLASPPGSPDAGSGILNSVPVQVTFGITHTGKPWAFTGTITSCSVQYLLFTRSMTPTVAQVDLTLTRRYYTPTTSTTALPAGAKPGGTSTSPATGSFNRPGFVPGSRGMPLS